MGIFDFFRKKDDIEEYLDNRNKQRNLELDLVNSPILLTGISNEKIDEINKVLVLNENDLEKIKKVRMISGFSLKMAKEIVQKRAKVTNKLENDINSKTADKQMSYDTNTKDDILRSNLNKIEKIKRIRELLGISLKEAKEMVDRNDRIY